jgi:hypothetical protein
MTAVDGPVPTKTAIVHPTAMRTELVRGESRRRARGRVMRSAMVASSHRGAMPVVFTSTRAMIEFTLMTATGSAQMRPSEIHG